MNTDSLFRAGNPNYRSHLKGIFIFFFYQLLEKENLFPQYYVLGLKMTCQWKDKYIIDRLGGPYSINLR